MTENPATQGVPIGSVAVFSVGGAPNCGNTRAERFA
jgi:hypothetical protein